MLTRFHLRYTKATSIHQIFHVCQGAGWSSSWRTWPQWQLCWWPVELPGDFSTWWSYILVFATYMVLQSSYHSHITSHMTPKHCNHNTYHFFLSLPLANQTNEVATDYNAGFQSALAGLNKIYGWPYIFCSNRAGQMSLLIFCIKNSPLSRLVADHGQATAIDFANSLWWQC